MDEGCGGETCQRIAGQPLSERISNPFSGFGTLPGRPQPFIRSPIFQIGREGLGLFPNLLDMGEKSPPILPGKAVEAEEADHPLKSSWEAGRLIRGDSSVGQPKFQRNRSVAFRRLFSIERTKNAPRLMMASQNNRGGLGCIGPESIEPVRVIEQGDVVALSMKMVRGCQAGQSGAKNEDGAWGRRGHENRERSQIRRAITTRRVVVRPMRGPKT